MVVDRTGSCEEAVEGFDARVEQLGHVGGIPAEDIAEDHRRPFGRLQFLQTSEQRRLHYFRTDRRYARTASGAHTATIATIQMRE